MSDIVTTDFSVDTGVEAPSEGLASEDTSTPSESVDAPEGDLGQESEAIIDSLFEVDGAGITLDEARNGYLRQADYTRKTQELSDQRSRLAQAEAITAALEKDPVATLQALQEAFGVSDQSDPYEGLDPEQARISAIEARLGAQDEAQRQSAIDRELSGLHETYGEFVDAELFTHAIKGGFPNLKAAYADMEFDGLRAQMLEVERQKQDTEARRASAREATSAVHGAGGNSAASAPSAPAQMGGIREAYLAARKTHGI